MLLDPYYAQQDNFITITAEQACTFAKKECQDFNPIHDRDSKRFCIPGDLLFSLALKEYGASESMHFTFTNMVKDNVPLNFPKENGDEIEITNEQGKSVLEITKTGKSNNNPDFIDSLIKNYVLFSGQNFPTLLMPLLEKHQVMFNPEKPLVMYNSMSFKFDNLNVSNHIHVELSDTYLEVEKKRGNFFLHFDILDGDKIIGRGIKTLVVAGLRPYEHESITACCDRYLAMRNAF
jgi:hypothetical protein